MAKWANPRKIKAAHTYSFEQASETLGVAIMTLRSWEAQGLRVLKSQRPYLIIGDDLRTFLETKKRIRRQPLQPGQFYCLHCKQARWAFGAMADFVPQNELSGRLIAFCEVCEGEVRRFVKPSDLTALASILEISVQRASDT